MLDPATKIVIVGSQHSNLSSSSSGFASGYVDHVLQLLVLLSKLKELCILPLNGLCVELPRTIVRFFLHVDPRSRCCVQR